MFSFVREVPPISPNIFKMRIVIYDKSIPTPSRIAEVYEIATNVNCDGFYYTVKGQFTGIVKLSEDAVWMSYDAVKNIKFDILTKRVIGFISKRKGMRPKLTYTDRQNQFIEKNKLKVGDLVVVHIPDTVAGWKYEWIADMNTITIGTVVKIDSSYIHVHNKFNDKIFSNYMYPYTAIRKLNPKFKHDEILMESYKTAETMEDFNKIVTKLKEKEKKNKHIPRTIVYTSSLIDSYDQSTDHNYMTLMVRIDTFDTNTINTLKQNSFKITEEIKNLVEKFT